MYHCSLEEYKINFLNGIYTDKTLDKGRELKRIEKNKKNRGKISIFEGKLKRQKQITYHKSVNEFRLFQGIPFFFFFF